VSELASATEALYKTFQVEKPGWFRREDWFVFNADEEQILVQEPLRSLQADTLNSYLFDYFDCFDYLEDPQSRKHLLYLLPRVLDLAPAEDICIDRTFTLIDHLKPLLTTPQTGALHRFLKAWWLSALDQPCDWWGIRELFEHSPDQIEWLKLWAASTSLNATLTLADTVRWTIPYEPDEPEDGLRPWLCEPHIEHRLEAAFFADPDGPHATELSDALTLWRGWVLGIWGSDPPD
jgi:hypothetical protein